jgi:hypothetical protein
MQTGMAPMWNGVRMERTKKILDAGARVVLASERADKLLAPALHYIEGLGPMEAFRGTPHGNEGGR